MPNHTHQNCKAWGRWKLFFFPLSRPCISATDAHLTRLLLTALPYHAQRWNSSPPSSMGTGRTVQLLCHLNFTQLSVQPRDNCRGRKSWSPFAASYKLFEMAIALPHKKQQFTGCFSSLVPCKAICWRFLPTSRPLSIYPTAPREGFPMCSPWLLHALNSQRLVFHTWQ